ncbi:MAG: hypothetical protein ACK5NK_08895 [Niabella sp.]
MEPTKLQLSQQELNLVVNANWILTKNAVLKKLRNALHELSITQKTIIEKLPIKLPNDILAAPPKITKGENYQGLPYLVLDHPGLFTRNHFFAIRTMFWWGKVLSTTLHLSGKWQQMYADTLWKHLSVYRHNDLLIASGDSEWVHDPADKAYSPVSGISKADLQQAVYKHSFLKLMISAPITDIEKGTAIWEDQFERIILLIASDKTRPF